MQQNPFTVLGLCPSILRGLGAESVRKLVKNQFLTLSMIHHPDRGGRASVFNKLNEANEELSSTESFEYWLRRFLKKKKDRLVDLENQVLDLSQELAESYEKFLYLLAVSSGQLSGSVSVLRNKRLLVGDTLKAFNYSRSSMEANKLAGGSTFSLVSGANESFELIILPDGSLKKVLVEKKYVEKDQEKDLKKLPKGWYTIRGGKNKSYRWERSGKETDLNLKLIGMISLTEVQNKAPQIARFKALFDGVSSNQEAFEQSEIGFSVEQLAPYAPYVHPFFRIHDVLIAVKSEEKPLLVVLGQVRAETDL